MSAKMTCDDVRLELLDYHRGRLPADVEARVRAHLDGCGACARTETVERALTDLLEQRLPQHAAPLALKRRLAAEWPDAFASPKPSWWHGWGRPLVPAMVVAVALLTVLPLYYQQRGTRALSAGLVTEAVNDHLRVLSSQHPLDIESGDFHQVKPWFEGRLDFAPRVSFLGDADFPLKGGAVGYILDRKAAVFVYNRRLHVVSLFVFRADGLAWPSGELTPLGSARVHTASARGFNTLLWRSGELGYALVSDVDAAELAQLAAKVAGGA
jgi:anti-sigma factor RsiW